MFAGKPHPASQGEDVLVLAHSWLRANNRSNMKDAPENSVIGKVPASLDAATELPWEVPGIAIGVLMS